MSKLIISSTNDGWIVLDITQVASAMCADESLEVHASDDGEHWWDVRGETGLDLVEHIPGEVGIAKYVRVKKFATP